jgi:DnaJ-class molecular chaperone
MDAVCPLPPIKPLSATNGDKRRGSTGPTREAHAAPDGPAAGGRPMTCPSCAGYGQTGYDRRQRPIPCRKCAGTGRITPAEPQRPAPTAPPDPFAALIP